MSNDKFYKYNFLTKKAFEFQSKIMSGKTMTFTKAEIGDGIITGQEEAEVLESLKNKICDIKILSIVPKDHMVELTVVLDGEGLSEVTVYREIGIYAQIDEEEILYAYLNSDDKFDYIIPLQEGSQREFTNNKIKITLVVGNAENIEVTLNNTIIPDNSITMDILNVEVKNYVEKIQLNLHNHESKSILDEEGIHGFKYNEFTNFLQYNKDGEWENIQTGQEVDRELNNHINLNVCDSEGVHGFKYDPNEKLQYYKDSEDNKWKPMHLKIEEDIELLKYLFSDKITENVFQFEKDDFTITGGCFEESQNKFYINKIEV